MEGSSGRPITTDMYVLLAHGKQEKEWPFMTCSDGHFTDVRTPLNSARNIALITLQQEFDAFRKACETSSIRVSKKVVLEKKLQDIHKLLAHRFTEDDLQYKLNLQNKYANLNKPATATPVQQPFSKNPQSDRLAALNKINRQRSSQEIRAAMLAERRQLLESRKAAAMKAEAEEKAVKEREQAALLTVPGEEDLFGGGSDLSRPNTPGIHGREAKKLQRTKSPLGKKDEKKGIPTFKKRNMDDDVIGSMDLGIEIDI